MVPWADNSLTNFINIVNFKYTGSQVSLFDLQSGMADSHGQ
jgi:hypothetical protein